ncbi:sensor domain-containing diguanylate cyclase [Ramlibacter humi]|uniref:Diguanylate cyclase n=1 Tax=Ramlibacter humi TaxID=2530451 RepID=A0A4Z0BHS1_9BURK|nr:7TM diverse intracellular signaling domain-containing protein [Ramlibacter humi]TFY98865.1 diguanylate cyclase [Ramlibacter humi]
MDEPRIANNWLAGWRRALAIWAVAVLLPLAAAAEPERLLTLDSNQGELALGTAGDSWMDTGGEAGIKQVAAGSAARWSPTVPGTVYPMGDGRSLWLRFTLTERDDDERWFLEIPYPAVDRVTLWSAGPLGQWTPLSAGDTLPVADWPLPHRHPLLPLALEPGSPRTFYVQVENPHVFSAPLLFTSERQLLRQEQRVALILGIYFGLAGLSVVLAAAAAAVLRDEAFAWYALSATLMGVFQASLTGVAGLHLWPHLARWNDLAALFTPVVAVASLLWFFASVISLRQRSEVLFRVMAAVSLGALLAAAVMPFVEPGWRLRLTVLAIVVAVPVGLSFTGWAAWRGDRQAGWLLVGLAPVFAAAMLTLARAVGFVPVGFWTLHGMQIGIAFELPMLLAVLARRSHDRRENRRRIHGLARTDPATGLVNRQVFISRLEHLIARSQRLRHQSVVLLVDIANVEQIRRAFDQRSAEEMPLRVAERLLSVTRDIDTAGRLSDHRFGLLLEGPLSPEDATAMGPKVVARCLMPFKGKPQEWVAQVRVAQTQVPNDSDAETVVERLETVLATVPPDSKRAVFTIR